MLATDEHFRIFELFNQNNQQPKTKGVNKVLRPFSQYTEKPPSVFSLKNLLRRYYKQAFKHSNLSNGRENKPDPGCFSGTPPPIN